MPLKTGWGCELSIYAEAEREADRRRIYQDDFNPLAEYLDTLSAEDNELWRSEALLVEELIPEHGLNPDFDQICERAIMERFAEEEAARAAGAA